MPLTAERLRELICYDLGTGVMTWRVSNGGAHAGVVAGSLDHKGRRRVYVDARRHFAHRLAWLYVHGSWPDGVIDHIDGNPRNNAIGNLRDVSIAINAQNRHRPQKNNKTGVLGVSQMNGRFRASITLKRTKKFLGMFDTAEEAYAAYVKAKRSIHIGCAI